MLLLVWRTFNLEEKEKQDEAREHLKATLD